MSTVNNHLIIKPNISENEVVSRAKSLNVWTLQTQKALNQVKMTHAKQVRDDNESYLTQHIYPIALTTLNYFSSEPYLEEIFTVSLLHDILEDDVTLVYDETQLRKDFGDTIANDIALIHKEHLPKANRTQEDKHQEHLIFMEKLKNAPKMIQILKILDRLNNLECTQASIDTQKYTRFLQDTTEIYLPLARKLDANLAAQMEIQIDRIQLELNSERGA